MYVCVCTKVFGYFKHRKFLLIDSWEDASHCVLRIQQWNCWSHFHTYLLHFVVGVLNEKWRIETTLKNGRAKIVGHQWKYSVLKFKKMSIMKIFYIMFILRSYSILLIFHVASLSLNNCLNTPGKRCVQIHYHLYKYGNAIFCGWTPTTKDLRGFFWQTLLVMSTFAWSNSSQGSELANLSILQHLHQLNPLVFCPVGWGCRIHWLHLCRGVRLPPANECPGIWH